VSEDGKVFDAAGHISTDIVDSERLVSWLKVPAIAR
jgi:hypothetical protein